MGQIVAIFGGFIVGILTFFAIAALSCFAGVQFSRTFEGLMIGIWIVGGVVGIYAGIMTGIAASIKMLKPSNNKES